MSRQMLRVMPNLSPLVSCEPIVRAFKWSTLRPNLLHKWGFIDSQTSSIVNRYALFSIGKSSFETHFFHYRTAIFACKTDTYHNVNYTKYPWKYHLICSLEVTFLFFAFLSFLLLGNSSEVSFDVFWIWP